MAKIQVIDAEDRTRVPFLRGILTRSLQDSGLSFEAAYSLASTIRQELGSIPEVTSRQLRDLVLRHIMDEYGPKVLERYRAAGVRLFETGRQGALTVRFSARDPLPRITAWREQQPRYWRWHE